MDDADEKTPATFVRQALPLAWLIQPVLLRSRQTGALALQIIRWHHARPSVLRGDLRTYFLQARGKCLNLFLLKCNL